MKFLRRMAWFLMLLISGYVLTWAAFMRWGTESVIDVDAEYGSQWLGINQYTDYGVYEYRFRVLDPELYELFTPLRWVAHHGWRAWHHRNADELRDRHALPLSVVDFARHYRQRFPQSELDWARVEGALTGIAWWQRHRSPHPAMSRLSAQAEDIQRRFHLALRVHQQAQETQRRSRELFVSTAQLQLYASAAVQWEFIHQLQVFHRWAHRDPLLADMLLKEISQRLNDVWLLSDTMIGLGQSRRIDPEIRDALIDHLVQLADDSALLQWLEEQGLHQHREAFKRQQQTVREAFGE